MCSLCELTVFDLFFKFISGIQIYIQKFILIQILLAVDLLTVFRQKDTHVVIWQRSIGRNR